MADAFDAPAWSFTDNSTETHSLQDVGLDGPNSQEEQEFSGTTGRCLDDFTSTVTLRHFH